MATNKTKATPAVNRDSKGHYTTPKCDHEHKVPEGAIDELQKAPAGAVDALQDALKTTVTVNTANPSTKLNVRAKPGLKSAIVGTLPYGTKVEVLELASSPGGWHKIEQGWIKAEFTK